MPADAARGSARHRSPGRAALRHGAVAAGITGGALALVGPAVLALPAQDTQDAQSTLALSAQGAELADGPASGTAATGGAVTGTGSSAASADLIKAVDRERRSDAAEARQTAAAGAAEQQRAAAAAQEQRTASLNCGASGSYGGVADAVQAVGNAMECVFPGHDVLGVGGRGNTSDHPGGYALDFMTTDGDTIADCMVEHASALNVSYVIWNQRINTGSGWERMEDRGGTTANHKDHVHISFDHGGSPEVSALRSCG